MPAGAVAEKPKQLQHQTATTATERTASPQVNHTPVEKTEKVRVELPDDDIEKAMNKYYGKPKNIVPEPELPIEPDMKIITLDDLEDESTLKNVENIPAWKRKLLNR